MLLGSDNGRFYVGVRRLELAPGDCHSPRWNLTRDPQSARPCFCLLGFAGPGAGSGSCLGRCSACAAKFESPGKSPGNNISRNDILYVLN